MHLRGLLATALVLAALPGCAGGPKPSSRTVLAGNPARSLHVGDNALLFCMVASPPNVSDHVGGRRTGGVM